MKQIWENGKKTNFGPYFGLFAGLLPLVVRHCCKLSLCVISTKTNEPNLRRW